MRNAGSIPATPSRRIRCLSARTISFPMAAGKTAMRATARRVKPWPAGNTGRKAASWGYLTINQPNRRPFKSASPLPLICRCSLSAEPLHSKQMERVQLPSAAPRAFARHNYSKNPVRKEETYDGPSSAHRRTLFGLLGNSWNLFKSPSGSSAMVYSRLPVAAATPSYRLNQISIQNLSIIIRQIYERSKNSFGNFSSAIRG